VIHGELAYPEAGCASGALVLAGPHPLLGGNMRNNVVRGVGDGLAQRGLMTLRFDYRGVGRSEGPRWNVAERVAEFWRTSHVADEMDFRHDLQGAVECLSRATPESPLALVGYSFGCALLPLVGPLDARIPVILIAPTVAKHDYETYRDLANPMLVIASDDDFATDADRLEHWLSTLTMPRQLVRQRCDNHFFRGHENWLTDIVNKFLMDHWRK
jgi:alpha/beta superfamily hydrolase